MIATALRALGGALGAVPQLNLWVRTAPRGVDEFCWHIDIVPRLTARPGSSSAPGSRSTSTRPSARPPTCARRSAEPASRGRAKRPRADGYAARPMPPVRQPVPRFIADASQEGRPYGRWEERLREEFAARLRAARRRGRLGARPDDRELVSRPLLGRARLRARQRSRRASRSPTRTARRCSPSSTAGSRSRRATTTASPADLRAKVDFTDVTADDNPDWKIDLNDDVIGQWRTDGGRGGDVTLVWGLPLVRGAVAVTAELDGEPIDQAPVADGRFTLVAVDAVHGFGDDLFLEVKLWGRNVAPGRLGEPLREPTTRISELTATRRWLAAALAIAALAAALACGCSSTIRRSR